MANKGNKKCGEIAAQKCADSVRDNINILCKVCSSRMQYYTTDRSYYYCQNCRRSIIANI